MTDTWTCETCKRTVNKRLTRCPRCGPTQPVVTNEAQETVKRQGSARGDRARTYRMIDALADKSEKYRDALRGNRFAMFSILGTTDWEDYASLSFRAMQAEALADIDARMEYLTLVVDKLDTRLARIVELMEHSQTSEESAS